MPEPLDARPGFHCASGDDESRDEDERGESPGGADGWVDVCNLPFEAEVANRFFELVTSRYQRVSVIVTSTTPFGRWGAAFDDPVVAAAMIDRLGYHAEVVSLKGDSYRLKDRNLGRVSTDDTE